AYAECRTASGSGHDYGGGGDGRVSPAPTARGYRLRQDGCLSCGDAARAHTGKIRDAAGSGDRADAGDGGTAPPYFRQRGGAVALGSYTGRTRGAVASYSAGRSTGGGGDALGGVCAAGKYRLDDCG